MARTRTPKVRGAPAVSSSVALFVAMVLTAVAAALVLLHAPRFAGGVALAAGAALLWGWYLAHAEGTARSRFTSMLVDPLYDSALLASIAWVARAKEPRVAVMALVALGLCYLGSYERARADALGFRTFESVGYRAARVGLISIGLMANVLTVALWLLMALAVAAVAVRAANVTIQHRRAKPRKAGATRRARSVAR
jgi:hypothetical protein